MSRVIAMSDGPMHGGAAKHEALRHQSLARALTADETALAAAHEAIFIEGTHDFAAVAAALTARNIARPTGTSGPWSTEILSQELSALNDSLDAAYATDGIGA